MALSRKTPLRRTRPKPWRRAEADKVTPDLHAYILQLDMGCVGPRLEMEGPCAGRIELDHILNGGTGRRGPSTPLNLVSLCSAHHLLKTDNARTFRPMLVEYVCAVEAA